MTLEQIVEYYPMAIRARLDYMFDVRMSVWSEGKEFDKYCNDIARR